MTINLFHEFLKSNSIDSNRLTHNQEFLVCAVGGLGNLAGFAPEFTLSFGDSEG